MEFSEILRLLLDISRVYVKDYAVAVEYDPSYISKWLSGSLLPTKKYSERVLNNSTKFFTDNLWGSEHIQELIGAFADTEVGVPEIFVSKGELYTFILRLFKSAYFKSSQPLNKPYLQIAPALPYLNSFISTNLDETLMLLHAHCKHMTTRKDVLRIVSTMDTDLLEFVVSTHETSYCMLFRARQLELNFFLRKESILNAEIARLTDLARRLRNLNEKTTIILYTCAEHDVAQYMYTDGCYYLLTFNIADSSSYLLIDNTDKLKELSEQVFRMPEIFRSVSTLNRSLDKEFFTTCSDKCKLLLRDGSKLAEIAKYADEFSEACPDILLPKIDLEKLNGKTKAMNDIIDGLKELQKHDIKLHLFTLNKPIRAKDTVMIATDKYVKSAYFHDETSKPILSFYLDDPAIVSRTNDEMDKLMNQRTTQTISPKNLLANLSKEI